MDKDFVVVRDYIYENSHADMDKVSEETGVSKQVIMYLLKEGRLVIEDSKGTGGGGILLCEVCKKPINTGRMCRDCKDKVASKMQKSITAHKVPEHGKSDPYNFKSAAKLKNR